MTKTQYRVAAKQRPKIVPRPAQGRLDVDRPQAPMSWIQRLKRVFAIDIETCPECGGMGGLGDMM